MDLSGIPTLAKQRELEQTLLDLNDKDDGATAKLCQRVEKYLLKLAPDERAAMKHVLFKTLADVDDANPDPYDAFCTDEMMTRVKVVENARNGLGSSYCYSRVADEDDGGDAWVDAYINGGVHCGDGSSEAEAVVMGPSQPTQITSGTLAISPEKGVAKTNKLYDKFADFLDDVTWQTFVAGKPVWARLHPWGVQLLTELFFENFIGLTFFKQFQEVIKSMDMPTAQEYSHLPAQLARVFIKKHDHEMPRTAYRVLRHFEKLDAIQSEQSAYSLWQARTIEGNMILAYVAFKDRAKNNPDSEERKYLEKHWGEPIDQGKQSVDRRVDLLLQAATGLDDHDFRRLMQREEIMNELLQSYLGGPLVVMRHDLWMRLGAIDKQVFSKAKAKFEELVPEFPKYISKLHSGLMKQLLDVPNGSIYKIRQLKVATDAEYYSKRRNNWVCRVEDLSVDDKTTAADVKAENVKGKGDDDEALASSDCNIDA